MIAGLIEVKPSMRADLVGELGRGAAGRPADIARRLESGWSEGTSWVR